MATIREIFGTGNVRDLMLAERSNYKLHPEYTLVNPDLIVGLELEIEKWKDNVDRTFRGFTFEHDGSLRGNAVEAITKPMYSKFVPEKLESFFTKFEVEPNMYSERCSTHVHVNCQDMEVEQVAAICLLYQLLERCLFAFIGHDRSDNIFCTPWSQCNISKRMLYKLLEDVNYSTANWQKYTALNLIPLRDRGTVEFRHLEGTCDVARITAWLNIIGSMFAYAKANKLEDIKNTIAAMNTVSNYDAFMRDVFGPFSATLAGYRNELIEGVIDCKMAILGTAVNHPAAVPPVAQDGDLFRMMDEILNNPPRDGRRLQPGWEHLRIAVHPDFVPGSNFIVQAQVVEQHAQFMAERMRDDIDRMFDEDARDMAEVRGEPHF